MKKLIWIVIIMIVLVGCQTKEITINEELEAVEIVEENTVEAEEDINEIEQIDVIVEVEDIEEVEESSFEGFVKVELFERYLEEGHDYDIRCLGRLDDRLFFSIENISLTTEKGLATYNIFEVSYDYETVKAIANIDCDFLPREEHAIYMTIPKNKYDLEQFIVYSEDSVYFYELNGKLKYSYVVFGDGDAPWNNAIEVVGELVDWYVYPGMSIIIYQDDEGIKYFNAMLESSELIEDIVVEDTDSWQGSLQSYVNDIFGSNLINIDDHPYHSVDIEIDFVKVLYNDIKGVLLLMEDNQGKYYFIKTDQERDYVELINLSVELYISTQREEANTIIPNTTLLPKPHWSDDLEIRFLNVYDPILERKIKTQFPSVVILPDEEDIVFQIASGELKEFIMDKDLFEVDGYMLEEDINIDFTGNKLKYSMIRWNEDRSEELLYAKDIEDDYFIVELGFEYANIVQSQIEETIVNNINYYRDSDVGPDIDFEWIEEKKLIVTVTNMGDNLDYVISLNGYITENGTFHYTWSSCHGYIGALEEYDHGFYDFTKIISDHAKFIVYDVNVKEEEYLGTINHYDYNVGTSAGNLVGVALPDEWGYYSYIYDLENDIIYDHQLHCSYTHDYFEYNRDLYYISNQEILKVESNGDLTQLFSLEGEASIYTVRKHPTDDVFCVLVDREYKDIALYILDKSFNIISEVDIEFYRLGFYGILIEPYWLDLDSVILTSGTEEEFNSSEFYTNVYNIYSGEIELTISDEKIMTISDDGEFIITQNVDDGESLNVYNSELELQYTLEINTSSDNSSYQYRDYWYGDILYLKYYDTNEVFKWNLSTNELVVLELPYKNFVIDEVIGEDIFKMFINVKSIRRSNPWWS